MEEGREGYKNGIWSYMFVEVVRLKYVYFDILNFIFVVCFERFKSVIKSVIKEEKWWGVILVIEVRFFGWNDVKVFWNGYLEFSWWIWVFCKYWVIVCF